MPILMLLKTASLVSAFIACVLAAYYVAALEILPPSHKGPRGLARVLALRRYASFRFVEPVVRWTASRVHGFVPVRTITQLDKNLACAGDPLGVAPTELIALCALGAVSGLLLGSQYALWASRSTLYPFLLCLLFGFYPWIRIGALQTERAVEVSRTLPAAVDLLCLALSAGLDFPSSVRQVVEKSGKKDAPLVQEFSIVLQELSLGKTRREALMAFAERNPPPSVKEFVASTIQAEEEGTPLAEVLRIQATVSRERRSVTAEETASRAALQLLMPMGLVFLSVLALIGGPLVLRLLQEFGNAK